MTYTSSAQERSTVPSSGTERTGGRRRAGVVFWLAAGVLLATVLGGTIPTPLYVVWQAHLHFSNGVLTAIFALYAAGTLGGLLVLGRLSDAVGRRPVLGLAIASALASTAVFLTVPTVAGLYAGRFLSGISTGLVLATGAAYLAELAPDRPELVTRAATGAGVGGLGLGPLFAGALAQFGPGATTFPFYVFLAVLVAASAALAALPETVESRSRPVPRLPARPPRGSHGFTGALAAVFAGFAVFGLFASLVPSFLSRHLHAHSPLVAGAVVFVIFAVATLTQLLARRSQGPRAAQAGLALLPPALGLVVAALATSSIGVLLVAAVVGGIGVGLAAMGSLGVVNHLAPADARGGLLAGYYCAAYVGVGLPVVGLGVASDYLSALVSTAIFAGFISLAAGLGAWRCRAEPAGSPPGAGGGRLCAEPVG